MFGFFGCTGVDGAQAGSPRRLIDLVTQ